MPELRPLGLLAITAVAMAAITAMRFGYRTLMQMQDSYDLFFGLMLLIAGFRASLVALKALLIF